MARRGHTNVDQFQDEAPPGFMNNFIEGLKTEFTGLNFPPNAATDTDNCVFTMLGDVTRRLGFDFEDNYQTFTTTRDDSAVTSYRWLNAGGDGDTQIMVVQVGNTLYFYKSSAATTTNPLSNQKLSTTVDLTAFAAQGTANVAQPFVECQFADGNGYLFVYHIECDPIYCTFDSNTNTVTANRIIIKIRDFTGAPETGVDTTHRDLAITTEHEYNLLNQGWSRAPLWNVTGTDNLTSYGDGINFQIPLSFTANGYTGIGVSIGSHTFSVSSGLPITVGTPVDFNYTVPVNIYDIEAVEWHGGTGSGTGKGVVTAYAGGSLTVNVTFVAPVLGTSNLEYLPAGSVTYNLFSSKSINTIDTWQQVIGSYPSNADIWWIFKDQNDGFNPALTIGNKGLPSAWAPKGHYIVDAFNQTRATHDGTQLQTIATGVRPTTGTWFQGRVWYTGVDASQQKTGDADYYTWTENIYFSKIVEGVQDFTQCHEDNDPTDQYSFNLLPSDGGVIVIQGSGTIFKLFPIQNGMLVFAANGIWFITGSQGIGFSAVDYTITKISSVRSISSYSFVDVQGLPIFWNEEGIYTIAPAQQGLGLTVNPITVGTIKSFYDSIPYESKRYARGSYDPINYVVQWIYNANPDLQFSTTAVVNSAGYDMTGWTLDCTWTGHPAISPPIGQIQACGLVSVIGWFPNDPGLYNNVDYPKLYIQDDGSEQARSVVCFGAGPSINPWFDTGLPLWAGVAERWSKPGLVAAPTLYVPPSVSANIVNSRYQYTHCLNYNVHTGAFYPWSISEGVIAGKPTPYIHDVKYVQNPGGQGTPDGMFKYVASVNSDDNLNYLFTFADCTDENYYDWDYATETAGLLYQSYFVTGYNMAGQGLHKFQPTYLTMFSRTNGNIQKYYVQGIWDFATNAGSGRWTNKQLATVGSSPSYGMDHKRHRIRGSGLALQIKVSSVDANPFDIMGWATMITQNQGV